MTAREELIQAIERSPDEIVDTLLEILRILQRQSTLMGMRSSQLEPEVRVLQATSQQTEKPKGLAAHLIGIAKTNAPAPTDEEVKAMLEERLVQKYL
jgi:hypothetical protein